VATSIFAIKFTDANTGYYASTLGVLKKTTDGGGTWNALTTGISSTINTIAFPSALVGYLGSVSGVIRKTTNGGTSWAALTTGVAVSIASIYFIDDSNGYAVGASGTILKTTDGGGNMDEINFRYNSGAKLCALWRCELRYRGRECRDYIGDHQWRQHVDLTNKWNYSKFALCCSGWR
jgi:photosystem II stability/assembly factor-like uncharacterized protein